jgi:hypothetical protein
MYESQKDSEVCERLKITKAPELTSADEELKKKKDILYNKENITMFCRVTCEIASVNNDFSRDGNFTCYPTKHVIFL